jgi:hypothetical protein
MAASFGTGAGKRILSLGTLPRQINKIFNRDTSWWESEVNRYHNPLGRQPGHGWILLAKEDVEALDQSSYSHELRLAYSYESSEPGRPNDELVISGLSIIEIESLTPLRTPDYQDSVGLNEICLVHIADARYYGKFTTWNKCVNINPPFFGFGQGDVLDGTILSNFYQESRAAGGTVYDFGNNATWGLIPVMWASLPPIFGATAPNIPTTTPDNEITGHANIFGLRLHGVNLWDAINDILEERNFAIALKTNNTFTIQSLRKEDTTGLAYIRGQESNPLTLDKTILAGREWKRTELARYPEKIRVYFSADHHAEYRQESTDVLELFEQDYADLRPLYHVDVDTDTITDFTEVSTVPGTILPVKSFTYHAPFQEDGTLFSATDTRLTLFAEVLAKRVLNAIKHENSSYVTLAGYHDITPSSAFDRVTWDIETGTTRVDFGKKHASLITQGSGTSVVPSSEQLTRDTPERSQTLELGSQLGNYSPLYPGRLAQNLNANSLITPCQTNMGISGAWVQLAAITDNSSAAKLAYSAKIVAYDSTADRKLSALSTDHPAGTFYTLPNRAYFVGDIVRAIPLTRAGVSSVGTGPSTMQWLIVSDSSGNLPHWGTVITRNWSKTSYTVLVDLDSPPGGITNPITAYLSTNYDSSISNSADRPWAHPNLIIGNRVICNYQVTGINSAGGVVPNWIVTSPYLDAHIGAIRSIVPTVLGTGGYIPQGWALMNGTANASGNGGSGIDMSTSEAYHALAFHPTTGTALGSTLNHSHLVTETDTSTRDYEPGATTLTYLASVSACSGGPRVQDSCGTGLNLDTSLPRKGLALIERLDNSG